ncbi:MAG: T9SS type A sorting domain-containing protein [Bacteroidia bacterium]
MKYILLVFLWLWPVVLLAQSSEDDQVSAAVFSPTDGQLYPGEAGLEHEVRQYLFNHFPQLNFNNASLTTVSVEHSPVGSHFHFQQQLMGLPVYGAYIKVNVSNDHKILSLFPSVPTYSLNIKNLNTEIIFEELNFNGWEILEKEEVVWLNNGQPERAMRYRIFRGQEGEMVERIFGATSNLLHEENLVAYFGRKDSLRKVLALVFLPDPLSTAHTVYGAPYVDANDANVPELNAQRKLVPMNLVMENKPYRLGSESVEFREMSPPFNAQPFFKGTTLFYERGDSLFEEVNVLYHLMQFREHINLLGYDSLFNRSIAVDARAYNGADQSSFIGIQNDPRLYFGTGGVDDAEDADVIIHEFSHALSEYASPGTRSGAERETIEEALCDYFACSYSRNLEEYRWERLFNWDGHNEFWDGRFCTSQRQYPIDLAGNSYTDAEILVAALMNIWADIGRDKADALMLASLYSLARDMKMSDFAKLYLQSDSLLFNKKYNGSLKLHFVNQGLMEWPVGIEAPRDLSRVKLQSGDFSAGGNTIYLSALNNEDFTLELLRINGQVLAQTRTGRAEEFSWNVPPVAPGVYLIRISSASGQRVEKVVCY